MKRVAWPGALLLWLLVLLAGTGAAAAAAQAPVLDVDTARALCGSSVSRRDAAITALGGEYSAERAELLAALRQGRIYYDKDSCEIFVRKAEGSSVVSLKDGAERSSTGLKKSGVSNAQRKRIDQILNSYALYTGTAAARAAAVAELLRPGAAQPELRTVNALLEREDDEEVYESLVVLRAQVLAQENRAGTQELLRALGVLRADGSQSSLQAAGALAASKNEVVASAARSAVNHIGFMMNLASAAETLLFGLSLGSVLVLAAIGLAITFGVMGVINMAHGEFIMLGAYTVWGLQQLLPESPGAALLLAIPGAFVVSGAAGLLLERGVIRFLYGRPLETLLATFGVSLILQQAVRSFISPLNRAVVTPEFMQGTVQLSTNLSITCSRIWIFFFCLLVFFLILLVMNRTRLGLEVRAVAQNRPIARALGIRAARVDALTFALGSGVAGMAGVALSQITNVGPNLGQNYIVDSFMVVVFGGVGNLWGTLTGGLIMGIANKFLEPLSGAMLSRIFILAGIILFIQKRPRGLFPQRGRAAED